MAKARSEYRNARRVTHNGETMMLADWAQRHGLTYCAAYHRLFVQKLPIDQATFPLRETGRKRGGSLRRVA